MARANRFCWRPVNARWPITPWPERPRVIESFFDSSSSTLQFRPNQPSKLNHSPANASLDSSERQAEIVRDFSLGRRGEEREFDHLTLILGKLRNRLPHHLIGLR